MIEKIETKVEELKTLLSEVKGLNKSLAKHGFELQVKTVSSLVKPKKKKVTKKAVEAEPAATPKKKASKRKSSEAEELDF